MAEPKTSRGANRAAVDGTLDALRDSGRITTEHRALVQLVCSLADAVDRDPRNASLWREYRGAVADLVNRLRSPVGDTTN